MTSEACPISMVEQAFRVDVVVASFRLTGLK